MSVVLSEIDDLIRPLHYYLTTDDRCLFLREYTSGRGYEHSDTNSLILNLKKSVDRRGTPQWSWKQSAIEQAATELRSALAAAWLASATLVPIPPSKRRSDPLYDGRMLEVLRKMDTGHSLDIRDVIYQVESKTATHLASSRRHPDEIETNYRLDAKLLTPEPDVVGLFDDVLTTGAHFRAASRLLSTAWPTASIVGIFIARRVVPDPDESPFDR